jgi:hypothetical protein
LGSASAGVAMSSNDVDATFVVLSFLNKSMVTSVFALVELSKLKKCSIEEYPFLEISVVPVSPLPLD